MKISFTFRTLLSFCFAVLILSSCKVGSRVSKTTVPDTVFVQDTVIFETDTSELAIDLPDTVDALPAVKVKDTLTIIGVGDIMMGTNYPNESYLPSNNARDLWAEVNDLLNSADVTFGNLEGVILDDGGTPKTCSNPDLCYLFRTPVRFAGNLVAAGFDVMSTANNHAGDFGDIGRESTMKVLDSLGIHHAGLLQTPFTTFQIDDVNYGFVAFSPNVGTVSIHQLDYARSIVAHLDTISDIVIVSFHGGAEGSKHQNLTRGTEMYYGENRGNVYKFAHEMIDAGADIIFGHGPHVVRAVEIYNNRFIIYSLGNFLTYARFNLRGENGLAPIVKVYTTPKGEFIKARVHSFIQRGEGGPVKDPENLSVKSLQRLHREDFPEATDLIIDDSGWIYLKEKTLGQLE